MADAGREHENENPGEGLLSWSPEILDCGDTALGEEVQRTVTFTNEGTAPVTVSDLRTSAPSEAWVVGSPERVIPASSSETVTIVFRAVVFGPRHVQLTFKTDLPHQPQGAILWRCFGGGPDIRVNPAPFVRFGRILFDAEASLPHTTARKLTVMNVGTRPAVPDSRYNLRLGRPDENGDPTQPWVTITPLDEGTSSEGTSSSELEVILPESYDNAKGLVAKVGENTLELLVRVTPRSLGQKRARISIFSNDPDEPEVHIELSAEALEPPPVP